MSGALHNALSVLTAGTPIDKTAAANRLAEDWGKTRIIGPTLKAVPHHPERPSVPLLVSPSHVKRRRLGSEHGRCALLHAIAHIEFNAIDLAADMIARFSLDPRIPDSDREMFVDDWIKVCHDEARHFNLVNARLATMDMAYGDLPAHNGLWEAAIATKDSFTARLAVAPMVLEARGLDVTPAMIKKLQQNGDKTSADILQIIYDDEIGHVAAGARWFKKIAIAEGFDPTIYFKQLVKQYFAGELKPPFNTKARQQAGMEPALYES